MAGIDKTYTSSFKEYKELVDWAQNQVISFKYGNKKQNIPIINYIYEWDEEDFGHERPVMNTPTWLDSYLIKNCPCQFVINRMNQVYSKGYLESLNIGILPVDFQQGRKIHVGNIPNKGRWWLQTKEDLWYNKVLDAWVPMDTFPYISNTMHFETLKSGIRRLRNMYLPSGITFNLLGTYDRYKITIK